MGNLFEHNNATSEWHSLVCEASNFCHIELTEDLESYLVFMLMRFTDAPDIAHSVLALEFLGSAHQVGKQRQQTLRDVGDTCLLFTGFFPGRAQRRRVRISYYIKLGKTAYSSLSGCSKDSMSPLFTDLSDQFVPLMDVLQSMRELESSCLSLDALQAEEIWNDTGSQHALETLHKFAGEKIILPPDDGIMTRH
jgi:hypothetical protein